MVFDSSGPLVKRCDGFDGSLWSKCDGSVSYLLRWCVNIANIHIWTDDNNDVCDDANDQCGDAGSIILFSQVVYHIANIYELMGDNDQATEWYK